MERTISAFVELGRADTHHSILISGEFENLVAHVICSFCGAYRKHDMPAVYADHILGVPPEWENVLLKCSCGKSLEMRRAELAGGSLYILMV